MKVLLLFLFVASVNCVRSQPDTTTLLKEAETQLNAGTSVSEVLTNKKYLSIHPDSGFRDLIEKFSSDKVLAIAPVKNESGKAIAGALVYSTKLIQKVGMRPMPRMSKCSKATCIMPDCLAM